MSPTDIERANAMLDPLRPAAVKIVKLTPHRAGQMRAFLSVETASGFVIHDCRLMAGDKGSWIAMPSRPLLDRDGKPRLDADGKQLWSPVVEFRDRATADRFSRLVLEALRRQHPEVFDGGAV